MKRRDWLLIVLDGAGNGDRDPMDRVRVQKALFVLGAELKLSGTTFYNFRPYDYGPFDAAVYDDAAELVAAGLVEPAQIGRYAAYRTTPEGHAEAKRIVRAGTTVHRHRDYIRTVREWVQGQTFNELVRAIYKKYPAMRVNSIFNG